MFLAISNTPRPYAWGSETAIANLLGRTPSGDPEAELWLGAHPGSPSRILEPAEAGGAQDLASWVATDPATALGLANATGRLPFLLKVLAASAPLSLQAHPTPEQARRGFLRENEEGVPPDAPNRNYKDEFAKPELIFALSDEFEALCGFRPLAQFRDLVATLIEVVGAEAGPLTDLQSRAVADDALPDLVAWLSNGGPDVDALVATVSSLAAETPPVSDELRLVARLAEQYPGDPGVMVALLLNHVTLARGEALYLPAGNIHAYLSGLGVELMAASDNVIRGGLTPKHVDVPELLEVLDFSQLPVPYLRPDHPAPGVVVFSPDVPDFTLVHFTGGGEYAPNGPAIALCTAGSMRLTGSGQRAGSKQLAGSVQIAGPGQLAGAAGSVTLARGDSVFVTPDEGKLRVSGQGELFLATTGS